MATEPVLKSSVINDPSTINRILHNALEHFSLYGYSGASVREITEASRVTKPTLYYYFQNKEDLYKKLTHTCFADVLNRLSEAVKTPGTIQERITRLIFDYCKYFEEKPSLVRFVHLMATAPDRTAPDVGFAEFGVKIREIFETVISEGIQKGELKPELLESVAYALMAIFNLRVSTLVAKRSNICSFSVIERAVSAVLGL